MYFELPNSQMFWAEMSKAGPAMMAWETELF
jgi:hypothetical protein